MTPGLDIAIASRFAAAALGHVTREWPNKMDHVMAGPEDVKGPRTLHPIFFGSFDWHSCVHGWWTLFTLYRMFPDLPENRALVGVANQLFTPTNMAVEVEYAARPTSRGFERPYGWAWLLMLAAELDRHGSEEGRRWAAVVRPLADVFARRMRDYLPIATYPVRVGTHYNTAFALRLTLDYARGIGDVGLAELCRDAAFRWHSGDRNCQAWEPSQDEFLSPALMEAELMRQVLSQGEFRSWLQGFLPRLSEQEPRTLFLPATVSDRTDGKIAHLDGLNLSRAWCWFGLASALAPDDPRRPVAERAGETHLGIALPHVTGDYMGEHWLASFALLALLERHPDGMFSSPDATPSMR